MDIIEILYIALSSVLTHSRCSEGHISNKQGLILNFKLYMHRLPSDTEQRFDQTQAKIQRIRVLLTDDCGCSPYIVDMCCSLKLNTKIEKKCFEKIYKSVFREPPSKSIHCQCFHILGAPATPSPKLNDSSFSAICFGKLVRNSRCCIDDTIVGILSNPFRLNRVFSDLQSSCLTSTAPFFDVKNSIPYSWLSF